MTSISGFWEEKSNMHSQEALFLLFSWNTYQISLCNGLVLDWDFTYPDIFTPSYTSMEVRVVLAGQMMKTLKYRTI